MDFIFFLQRNHLNFFSFFLLSNHGKTKQKLYEVRTMFGSNIKVDMRRDNCIHSLFYSDFTFMITLAWTLTNLFSFLNLSNEIIKPTIIQWTYLEISFHELRNTDTILIRYTFFIFVLVACVCVCVSAKILCD